MGKMCRRTLGKKGQQREIVVVIVVGLFLPQREERIGHWLKGRKEGKVMLTRKGKEPQENTRAMSLG